MRLMVLLGNKEKPVELLETDIILTQNYDVFLELRNHYKVYLVDFTIGYESEELRENINIFFENLDTKLKNMSNETYLRFFNPMYSIIKQIELISNEKEIDELVLIGGSDHIFISLAHSEGEGVKKLYSTEWFLNPVIFQYFKDRFKIKWLEKRNKFLMFNLNILREEMFFLRKLIEKIGKSILYSNEKNVVKKFSKKTVIVVLNLPLQLRHFKSFLNSSDNVDIVYMLPSRWNGDEKDINTIKRKVISLRELFKLIKRLYDKKIFKPKEMEFVIGDTKIKINSFLFYKSLKSIFLDYLIGRVEISESLGMLESPKKCIFTDMTFGLDILTVHSVSKKLNIPHWNFQYVSMVPMLFPNFMLADKYFLYSKNTYNTYKKYHTVFEYYLPIKKLPVESETNKIKLPTIVIFTQPDKYTERYLHFLKDLENRLTSYKMTGNIRVIVKPHYRQDQMDKFEQLANEGKSLEIVGSDYSTEELIINSDFIISMTSSVIFEALMLGKMSVIFNVDNQDDNLIYNGGNLFPEVNFVVTRVDEIIDIINNLDEYKRNFKARFESNIKDNSYNQDELLKVFGHSI
jgi:hypothetical protein